MQQQYWTAVVMLNEKASVSDHFSSFSSDEAHAEIRATLPADARLVALIPGCHAKNSFTFNSSTTRKEDWTRYIDPFEYGPTSSTRRRL